MSRTMTSSLYNLRADEDFIMSDEVKDYISSSVSTEKRTSLTRNVRRFYQVAVGYMKEKLPVQDKVLHHVEVTDLNLGDRSTLYKFMLDQFSCLIPKGISRSTLMLEYAKVIALTHDAAPEGRLDVRWAALKAMVDEEGQPIVANVTTVMLQMLAIPHSSAHCERIFSLVRNIKTDQRSSMNPETLEALSILKTRSSLDLDKDCLVRLKCAYRESLHS